MWVTSSLKCLSAKTPWTIKIRSPRKNPPPSLKIPKYPLNNRFLCYHKHPFFPKERGHLCRGKCYRHRNFRSFVLSEPNSNIYGLHKKSFFILKAVIPETNEYVAIKRVFQDKRYKNREHSIMKEINHTNCVRLLTSFFSNDEEKVSLFF